MRYRKKPVEVEAAQWNPQAKPSALPDWLWDVLGRHPEWFDEASGTVRIQTAEGLMVTVPPGWWIVKDARGLDIKRADVFAATYEPVPTGGHDG